MSRECQNDSNRVIALRRLVGDQAYSASAEDNRRTRVLSTLQTRTTFTSERTTASTSFRQLGPLAAAGPNSPQHPLRSMLSQSETESVILPDLGTGFNKKNRSFFELDQMLDFKNRELGAILANTKILNLYEIGLYGNVPAMVHQTFAECVEGEVIPSAAAIRIFYDQGRAAITSSA